MNACKHEHYCPNCRIERVCWLPECQGIPESARFCIGCTGKYHKRKLI